MPVKTISSSLSDATKTYHSIGHQIWPACIFPHSSQILHAHRHLFLHSQIHFCHDVLCHHAYSSDSINRVALPFHPGGRVTTNSAKTPEHANSRRYDKNLLSCLHIFCFPPLGSLPRHSDAGHYRIDHPQSMIPISCITSGIQES